MIFLFRKPSFSIQSETANIYVCMESIKLHNYAKYPKYSRKILVLIFSGRDNSFRYYFFVRFHENTNLHKYLIIGWDQRML